MTETPLDLYRNMTEHIFTTFGLKPTLAKLFALIACEVEELSLDELVTKSGYSLASISEAVRFLEVSGHVHRFRKPASKKIYVKAEHDILTLIYKQVHKGQHSFIHPMLAELPHIIRSQKKQIQTIKNTTDKKKHKEMLHIFEKQYIDIQKLEQIYAEILIQLHKEQEK